MMMMMLRMLVTDLRDTEANMLLDKLQVLNSIVDDHEVNTHYTMHAPPSISRAGGEGGFQGFTGSSFTAEDDCMDVWTNGSLNIRCLWLENVYIRPFWGVFGVKMGETETSCIFIPLGMQ